MINFEDLALAFEHLVQDYTGCNYLRADLFRACPDIDISKSKDLKQAKHLGEILAYVEIALCNLMAKYEKSDSEKYHIIEQCKDNLSDNPNYQCLYETIETLKENKIIV
ncbi:MAG: hypothetical protein J6M30_05980 [Bacteroidales bacterium]|nr:hypothetical protein [Bacteroidales bacterium]